MMEEIDFRSHGVLTLGVEVEVQLIDQRTWNLVSRAEEVLEAARAISKIKPEFYLSTIEINTGKCANIQEVEEDLRETLAALVDIGDRFGIAFSATGTHPFAKYADCIISPTKRYRALIDRYQWLTRRMTVFGLHVHIGMASGDDCIRFGNFFMYFLPHLLALSGSSPFWQGMDTGLSSCRPVAYEALPIAGQPYHVRDWHEFVHLYTLLRQGGSIQSLKDLGWDWRPSPAFGTLEIRTCDGAATLYETLAITAFIHTLAHWFHDNINGIELICRPAPWVSRENKWRVMRYGLEADLLVENGGKSLPLRDDIRFWVDKLLPYAMKLGYLEYFLYLDRVLRCGGSAARQRQVFEETASLEEVVKFNAAEFRHQSPLWNSAPEPAAQQENNPSFVL